jgi:hypothetical protein
MKRHRTHRRILTLLIALALCAALLVGCDGAPSGPVYTFTEFLDREGFTEHLNQMDFEQKMEAYIVDGEALWGLVGPSYMCGDVNNTIFGWGELYGYEHSSSRYEDRSVSTYSVYTDVLFDGFTLPYGLAYGNSLETVARRLGLDASPLKNFTPDDADEPYLMTLWQKEDASLTFEDLRQMPHLTTTRPFILTYTETSEETNEAGELVKIRREVELRFDEDATLRTISFERGQTRYYAAEEGTPE